MSIIDDGRSTSIICEVSTALQLSAAAVQLRGQVTEFGKRAGKRTIESLSTRRIIWFCLVQAVRICIAVRLGLGGMIPPAMALL